MDKIKEIPLIEKKYANSVAQLKKPLQEFNNEPFLPLQVDAYLSVSKIPFYNQLLIF